MLFVTAELREGKEKRSCLRCQKFSKLSSLWNYHYVEHGSIQAHVAEKPRVLHLDMQATESGFSSLDVA